jgi:hypothetical protein
MRNVRPDADHVEIERAKCEHIGPGSQRLPGNADHHAAASLVAELLESAAGSRAGQAPSETAGMNVREKILV